METKNINLLSLSKNEKIFIILGHEINQTNFELSFSSKQRCKLLARKLKENRSNDCLIIFMGLGRLQGKCKLSISECMFNFFCKNYFTPKNFLIDKFSVDTIGDAIFSYKYTKNLYKRHSLFIVTSDWHIRRTEHIFKKIYPKDVNLAFLGSKEEDMFDKKKLSELQEKEQKSIILFDKTLKKFEKEDHDLITFLKNNHDFY